MDRLSLAAQSPESLACHLLPGCEAPEELSLSRAVEYSRRLSHEAQIRLSFTEYQRH